MRCVKATRILEGKNFMKKKNIYFCFSSQDVFIRYIGELYHHAAERRVN